MKVLAISRQIGAGETTIAPAVAERLGWRCVDHEILDREAAELGAPLPKVAHYDEHAPGLLESWAHPQEADQYFACLERMVTSLAEEGNVVVVGRGAGFMLGKERCHHVRLIASMPFRLERVMEVRWASETHALEIIRQSDHDRGAFHRRYFNLDWDDPVHYDVTLATSMIGIEPAIDLLTALAYAAWP